MDPTKYNYKVSRHKEHQKSYIVCFLSVPAFPHEDEKCRDKVHQPKKAVIGAAQRFREEQVDGDWAFINFSGEEKELIGEQLLALNAKDGEWFYCTQYNKEYLDKQESKETQ